MKKISLLVPLLLLLSAAIYQAAMLPVALAQSEPTVTPAPEEEAVDDAAMEEASIEEQVAQMALLNPPPQLSERAVGITEIPCDVGAPTGPNEVEGESYYCGIFTVPLFWDVPDAGTIDLRFIVSRATDENPGFEALLYLAGGPGQSSILSALGAYAQLRPGRDIVRLDQRGTGLSQRLGLEECLVLALNDEDAAEEVGILLQAVSPPEEGTEEETAEQPSLVSDVDIDATVDQLCAREFTNQGIDLNAFTTKQSARDMVELLKALDYKRFDLHGISYGTRLAMAIMADLAAIEDAPELRSVVLDSPFPPSVYLLSSIPHNLHEQVLQLFADCRQDDACRTAYPNLEHRFGDLLAQLEDEPLRIDRQTVRAEALVQTVADLSNTRAAYMPKMIAELEEGVLDTYLALQNGEVGTEQPEGDLGLNLSDPVQVFVADSIPYVAANGDLGEMIGFMVTVSQLLAGEDPLTNLRAYIDENSEGEAQAALTDLAVQLTPEDVADSPLIQQMQATQEAEEPSEEEVAAQQFVQDRLFAIINIAHFLNKTIHCNEDIQFERLEDGINALNDLEFPQFVDREFLREQAVFCDNWPVEAAPIDVKNPVSSTVPTLILQGAYDTKTPPYMGRRASRELENSTLVMVPQQGHEVWTSGSSCIGQIAAAFVLNPEAALDLFCLEERRPKWALPEDADGGTAPLPESESGGGGDHRGYIAVRGDPVHGRHGGDARRSEPVHVAAW